MLDDALFGAAPVGTAAARSSMRAVHRAMADLRAGEPVLLDGPAPLLIWSAETAGAAGLAAGARLCAAPPVLLLTPQRAAALLRRATEGEALAFATDGLLDEAVLRGVADPTAAQLLAEPLARRPVPALAGAALALLKLARLLPAAVAAPARPETAATAIAEAGLLRVRPADVEAYPAHAADSLQIVSEARVPLESTPDARLVAFRAADGAVEHIAIVVGDPAGFGPGSPAPLVRVHSQCFTGDLLGSLRCDCGQQLSSALARIAREGAGTVLYLAQEGRGIGLTSKLRAYALQDGGLDTVDANHALGWHADERDFHVAATMLQRLGLRRIRLLTNNPDKLASLAAYGIAVEQRVPLVAEPNGVDDDYLRTKALRFGHML